MNMKLRDGSEIPAIGFGTGTIFFGKTPEAKAAIAQAATVGGCRLVDCASYYDNEEGVGEALKEAFDQNKVKREDLFITTKVLGRSHTYEQATACMESSLKKLQVDYVDLMLHHWPGALLFWDYERSLMTEAEIEAYPKTLEGCNEGRAEVWRALQDMKKTGKVRHIGLSNYTKDHIEALLKDKRCTDLPEVHQVELHPYFVDQPAYDICKEKGILVQAYGPLGAGTRKEVQVLENSVIKSIAAAKGCSPAQVSLAWSLQHGNAIVTTSTSMERMKQNLAAEKITLTEEEMKQIDGLGQKEKIYPDPHRVM